MLERQVVVPTADGDMRTFIAQPEGPGPFAAVVMFQNVGGLTEILKDMARRVAATGYYCAVPDFYYRLGEIAIDPDSDEQAVRSVRSVVVATMHEADRMLADTAALLKFIDNDPVVGSGPKGGIGYCMGGRFVAQAAARFPDVFKATSSLFGTRLFSDAPSSPHLRIGDYRGEVYFGFAEHDHAMPLDKVAMWRELMEQNCKAQWEVELHYGSHHGYAFPGRKVYHRQASELSWDKTFAMFKRQLIAARQHHAA
jgi:carboxymethylenebutenolidase